MKPSNKLGESHDLPQPARLGDGCTEMMAGRSVICLDLEDRLRNPRDRSRLPANSEQAVRSLADAMIDSVRDPKLRSSYGLKRGRRE